MVINTLTLAFLIFYFNSEIANSKEYCKTLLQKYAGLSIYNINICAAKDIKYNNIFDTNFTITLHYLKNSSSKWIINRSIKEIKKHYNLTKEDERFYQETLTSFPDIKVGDEVKMNFNHIKGITIFYNNKLIVNIDKLDYSIKFANIWLHPNSTFKKTRDLYFYSDNI
jgi:hypothetical protein